MIDWLSLFAFIAGVSLTLLFGNKIGKLMPSSVWWILGTALGFSLFGLVVGSQIEWTYRYSQNILTESSPNFWIYMGVTLFIGGFSLFRVLRIALDNKQRSVK